MKARTSREREATAYHEAGHAVAAYLEGRPIALVTILPQEDSLGRVTHPPMPKWFQPDIVMDGRTLQRIEDHITILLAGPAAERDLTGRWNHVGAEHDREMALTLASYANGSQRATDAYLDWRQQVTEDMVATEPFRRLAAAVSADLLERERLSSRDVRRTIQGAMP